VPKLAFVFPGQGSQYLGMGKELADQYPVAAEVFAQADAKLGFPISHLCFHGPEEDLGRTINTQPAILTTSVACLRMLEAKGVSPAVVAGHSLGEYSGLVAAGSLDFGAAVTLVRERGRLMTEAVPPGLGGMVALLGLERGKVEEVCREASARESYPPEIVEPANFNCPGQVVVAGNDAALERVAVLAKKAGAKRAMRLNVSGPFHTSLMGDAAQGLKAALALVTVREPAVPLVANISGDYVQTSGGVRDALISQVCGAVRWDDSIQRMARTGVDTFIEVGPGKVLSGLIRKIAPEARTLNVEDRASLENTLAILRESD